LTILFETNVQYIAYNKYTRICDSKHFTEGKIPKPSLTDVRMKKVGIRWERRVEQNGKTKLREDGVRKVKRCGREGKD
jgi:hypothetical protein